jgi:hypothetical protein
MAYRADRYKEEPMRFKIISTLFVLFFGFQAHAGIVDINHAESKVYYAATPTLEINVVDLGADGGFLSMSLKYDAKSIEDDIVKIHQEYPNYLVLPVLLQSDSLPGEIEFPSVGLKTRFPMNNSAEGIYINVQQMITPAQVQQFIKLGQGALADIKTSLPVGDGLGRSYGLLKMKYVLEIN